MNPHAGEDLGKLHRDGVLVERAVEQQRQHQPDEDASVRLDLASQLFTVLLNVQHLWGVHGDTRPDSPVVPLPSRDEALSCQVVGAV